MKATVEQQIKVMALIQGYANEWAVFVGDTSTLPPALDQYMLDIAATFKVEVFDDSDEDTGPHSRACGVGKHEHGTWCHSNCPTCGGK